jgi:hypothetical protein
MADAPLTVIRRVEKSQHFVCRRAREAGSFNLGPETLDQIRKTFNSHRVDLAMQRSEPLGQDIHVRRRGRLNHGVE